MYEERASIRVVTSNVAMSLNPKYLKIGTLNTYLIYTYMTTHDSSLKRKYLDAPPIGFG